MGLFRTYLESSKNIDDVLWNTWKKIQIRRIGSVREKGKTLPLFWDYRLGVYIVGKPRKDKSPLTFYDPGDFESKKTFKTIEELESKGFDVSKLGFAPGGCLF